MIMWLDLYSPIKEELAVDLGKRILIIVASVKTRLNTELP